MGGNSHVSKALLQASLQYALNDDAAALEVDSASLGSMTVTRNSGAGVVLPPTNPSPFIQVVLSFCAVLMCAM